MSYCPEGEERATPVAYRRVVPSDATCPGSGEPPARVRETERIVVAFAECPVCGLSVRLVDGAVAEHKPVA